ncbi:FAD binding domain-containing protein [Streptomyces sp. NRRL F-5126]|uniref:FAD binding domain-containing protein n=1 Tax=Streptomyces sp. NRRL F-5126 TaxID=1463857 RepID=UPI0004CAC185|nr:FAD binding domain-containing protein [Streptomyces sp. NRRL F-5126]
MTTLAPGPAPLDARRAPVGIVVPGTVDEAVALLAADDAAALGGGVRHALDRHHRNTTARAATLVSLAGLPGLSEIRHDSDGTTLGAGMRLEACAADERLARVWPAVSEACGSVATARVRRLVTLGGNIAARDDAHDPPVALTAAGAVLAVRGARGPRTLAMGELTGPGGLRRDELIESVRLPLPRPEDGATGSAFEKFLVRGVWEYACVHVAAVASLDAHGRARRLSLAVGSVEGGPVAVDLTRLLGETAGEELVAQAAATAASSTHPYDDVRGSAAYKTRMIAEFARRALTTALRRARGAAQDEGGGR